MNKLLFLALLSSSVVYGLVPEKPVDQDARHEKFAGVERMRGWDDQKKDDLYRDLASKPMKEVEEKYKGDFDADELKDLKDR